MSETTESLTPKTDSLLDPPDPDYEPSLPDNPLVDGDREYSVRLVYRVQADNPEHARTRFIAYINDYGLNNWTYRVTDIETDEDFLVQDGAIMTPEEFSEKMGEDDTEDVDTDGRT